MCVFLNSVNTLGPTVIEHQEEQERTSNKIHRRVVPNHRLVVIGRLKDLTGNRQRKQVAGGVGQEDDGQT